METVEPKNSPCERGGEGKEERENREEECGRNGSFELVELEVIGGGGV